MGTMQLSRLLLVEDDRSIASALAQVLRSSYEVDVAATGKLALYKTGLESFDIIVLDLNLPDMSGIIICQQLRARGVSAPILILSGEARVLTKINLLDSGANDYLTKPFSLGELKARLRALLRINHRSIRPSGQLIVGDLVLDRPTQTVSRCGQIISLRRKEFDLLKCLMEHAGSVVSRETLYQLVWRDMNNLWTNTVDVHIKHLRDKIDRPFGISLIHTVHGLGYKVDLQPVAAKAAGLI